MKEGQKKKAVNGAGFSPFTFFGEVKQEFKKVSWTSTEELKVYTRITLIAIIVMGIAVYVADLVFQSALVGVDSAVKGIFG